MSGILGGIGDKGTPKSFIDGSRPIQMMEADTVFQRIALTKGSTTSDINTFMGKVTKTILATRSYQLDQFWPTLEAAVVGREQKLPIKSGTDDGKMQVALSMFYSALDVVDRTAVSTGELSDLRTAFSATAKFVLARFASGASTKDKRIYERIVDTIDKRFDDVSERFDARVDAREIRGPKLG